MKKIFLVACAFFLVLSFTGVASATVWTDYDFINKKISEGQTYYWYDLDIAVADTFIVGTDVVGSAEVKFWFSDDGDSGPDTGPNETWKEYAWAWVEETGWSYVGEVDFNDTFTIDLSGAALNTLNAFGNIYTAVYAGYTGDSSSGDFYWKAAQLTATSVPEPGTIVLMGLGLVGLAGMGRKKLFKK
jgi:hypothetical protein